MMNLDHQKYLVECERRKKHEEWCAKHVNDQRFDHPQSHHRAVLLLCEARRLEKEHLNHQYVHCKKLLHKQRSSISSPSRMSCESSNARDCPCLRAPIHRQLLPKFRAMHILLPHFQDTDLEGTIETLQQTYNSDHDMIEDLLARYGPEDTNVDPRIWMRSIEFRMKTIDPKWKSIATAVKQEFRFRDNFPVVIRNLSIMRIFLEGSQAPTYSCDVTERARRDAYHQSVLFELERRGSLFLE
jgi:hypothetical protein